MRDVRGAEPWDTEDMGRQRPGARRLRFAVASAAPLLYALWVRPLLLTWGATRDETTLAYPGDELVQDPDGGATMATTLPAPPETVWAWLVQMGGDRGGWYSWDWLDNNGRPSADRIVPEWQSLEQGQHLHRVVRPGAAGTGKFTVVTLEPNRALVLRSTYELPSWRSFDPGSGVMPRAYGDGIWGWHLRPLAGGRTRLVVRTRSQGRPRQFTWAFGLLVGEPVHFIMQTRQFHNLRTRVGAEV